MQLLPPLVGQVEGPVQGTLSVALKLLALNNADLWSAAQSLASAAFTPVAAACSTKVWQASVTWLATMAPTSRALGGGGLGHPFATFDGLGEGVGALPLGVGEGPSSDSTSVTSCPRLVGLSPLGAYD